MESKIDINDSDNKELHETSRKLLWIDISNFSELWQFLFCSFVVFIFFIPYGYLQVYFILFAYLNFFLYVLLNLLLLLLNFRKPYLPSKVLSNLDGT